MARRWKIFLAVASLAVLADQLTKVVARGSLPASGVRVPFIEGSWDWVLAQNKGMVFSMLSNTEGARVLLAVAGFAAIITVVWLVHKTSDEHRMMAWAFGLMAGGAVGNLIDRVLFGSVTDFILWHYGQHRWPVFNVADVVLCGAAGLFVIASVRDWREHRAETERT